MLAMALHLACCIHDYYAYDCPRLMYWKNGANSIIGATSSVMFALGATSLLSLGGKYELIS